MFNHKEPTNENGTENVAATSEVNNGFEAAIAACGFGMFNICLLLVAIPGFASTIFETTTMSYVLPMAECELKLSLMNKGTINAVVYGGMILAGVPLGFMADTYGRKRMLTYSMTAQGFFVLCGALSQNFIQLAICKFFSGICACGPFAVFMSYISEFHGKTHRPRIMMLTGILKTTGLLVLPILAYLILPRHLNFEISGIKFHTWQVFVAITAVPCLLTSSVLVMFPESPKFLMTQGKNAEALEVFKTVYSINTGQPRDTYPLKQLFDEAPEKTARNTARTASLQEHHGKLPNSVKRRYRIENFRDGVKQLRPLFSKPFVSMALNVFIMQFFLLMGVNSLRLWLPQLFASQTELEKQGATALDVCSILEYNVNKTQIVSNEDCEVNIKPDAYVSNIIVAAAGFIGFLFATLLVNKIGNKIILCSCLIFSAAFGCALYLSETFVSTLIISAVYLTTTSVSSTTILSASVNLFPTVMRSMIVMLIMTFGRCGSLLGNLLLPYFISLGCLPPFLMVGSSMFVAFLLSLFLPDSTKLSLK